MAEPRQEHCHPLNWTCGAPAGCHGYSCRASLLPPQIASTGVANEMCNYDFQDDYLPAIICGIIMMINALWRSDGCNSGADRSLSLCSHCTGNWLVCEHRCRGASVYWRRHPLSSDTENKAALKPNGAHFTRFLWPFVTVATKHIFQRSNKDSRLQQQWPHILWPCYVNWDNKGPINPHVCMTK